MTSPPKGRCKNCGKKFTRTQPHQTFCRAKCRWEFHRDGKTPQERINRQVKRALDELLPGLKALNAALEAQGFQIPEALK